MSQPGREIAQKGKDLARRIDPPLKPEEREMLTRMARELLDSSDPTDKDGGFFLFGMAEAGGEVSHG